MELSTKKERVGLCPNPLRKTPKTHIHIMKTCLLSPSFGNCCFLTGDIVVTGHHVISHLVRTKLEKKLGLKVFCSTFTVGTLNYIFIIYVSVNAGLRRQLRH